jgi:hypothetical protein
MTTRSCVQCGQALPDNGKFCGQCGAVNEPPAQVPPQAPPAAGAGARTVIQASPPVMSSPHDETPLAPSVATPPPPAAGASAANKVPLKTMMGFAPAGLAVPQQPQLQPQPQPAAASKMPMKTMVGFAAPNLQLPTAGAPAALPATEPGAPAVASAAPAASPASPASPAGRPAQAGMHRTMLGGVVAAPAGPEPPAAAASGVPARPQGIAHGTMLGVAMPGIAPLRASEPVATGAPPAGPAPAYAASAPVQAPQRARAPALGSTVALVAAPAPLEEIAAPPPPRIVKAGGIPLVTVASIMGGLVLVGGVAFALLWRQPPPISAQPKAAPDGKDVLHLTCDPASCKDGTIATLGAVKATFAGGEAELTLAEPLRIGDNDLSLQIERPGLGRNEAVKMVVPVAFRVHADITTMTATHPAITIRAEALPGSDVRIDGKPVALDASGVGSYAIDETAATDGPADESRTISVDVPYVVVPKGGKAQNGTVSARLAIAPLRVDAPGTRGVVEEDHVLVAGRAAKAATVTVDGAPVAVGPDGSFETTVSLPLGDRVVDVRGGTASLMPRTAHVALRRVASLADEAKALEAKKPMGYDAAMADLTAGAGQPIALEGEVFESRGSGHRTLVLLDDRRGCAKGACIAKIVIGHEVKLARGEGLRVYGTLTGGSPYGSQTVPEVAADFVLRSKR